jgi:hypothetical protein
MKLNLGTHLLHINVEYLSRCTIFNIYAAAVAVSAET